MKRLLTIVVVLSLLLASVGPVQAVGVAGFQYHGYITQDGTPVTGECDFDFALFDASTSGNQIGTTQTHDNVTVTDGWFWITLNFGSVFDGTALWLETSATCDADPKAPLSPRQEMGATPYALYALSSPWSGLTGVPAGFADGTDDATSFTAGDGLAISGTEIAVDFAVAQVRVTGSCSAGQFMQGVNADGSVNCGTDADTNTTYSDGSGLSLSGTVFSVDYSEVQARIGTNCDSGYVMTGVNASGVPTCTVDLGGAHTLNGAMHTGAPLSAANGGTATTTAFTAGSVVFSAASGVYTQDNSNFFWDDTNNRLGLGTTSPAQQLQLTGNLRYPSTTNSAPYGIIYKGTHRFLYDFKYGSQYGYNTFLGEDAGNMTMGSTATDVLQSSYNVGIGVRALLNLTLGHNNMAIGSEAMYYLTTGNNNAAFGTNGLIFNQTGSNNVSIGTNAGIYHANGSTALNHPENSIYIGAYTRGYNNDDDNVIVIGTSAVATGANQTVIGNTSITKTTVRGDLVTTNGSTAAGGVTKEGGYWSRMVAGEALSRGNVLCIIIGAGGADGKVYKCPAGGSNVLGPIGIAYQDASANGEVWVVTTGIAYVLPHTTVTATRGYILYLNYFEAGRANQTNTAATDYTSIGFWLDTGASSGALTRAVIHIR